MAHLYRVRRPGKGGRVVVELRTDTLAKALRTARRVARETQRVVRVERKVERGWETAAELFPAVRNPVELAIARGQLPRVRARGSGRAGRVVAYIRPTRTCRVAWQDQEGTEEVPVDELELRP